MVKRTFVTFLTLTLAVLVIGSAVGQVATQPFAIRDANKEPVDVDHFIIKGDNRTYEFKMDTASVDYKSLSRIDPNWIKKVEILKGEQLHGGDQTVVIITLKKGKIKRLPDDMRAKFA
jgi:hypothetical protein